MFISHYNGHELRQLDHCLLWITLATMLVYPTVDSGLTITSQWFCGLEWRRGVVVNTLVSINEVALHRAWLLLGWVTVC